MFISIFDGQCRSKPFHCPAEGLGVRADTVTSSGLWRTKTKSIWLPQHFSDVEKCHELASCSTKSAKVLPEAVSIQNIVSISWRVHGQTIDFLSTITVTTYLPF